ncbi:glycoside hydrolase family 10 protein [Saltatorellus ferox]|uniref:glycoside hydrolase family 10 protein n=1 Tax=Saltatorellus ferox TaxID=2528018 RepID=UPI003AF3ED5B
MSAQEEAAVAVRGVWIPNSHSTFFESRANVAEQMEILASSGINVVFPVVWSKGHTLFRSAVAEKVTGHAVDPRYGDRDPLAEVLFEAHVHGIEVIPWFEYGFAAGHETFPGKALVKHPEWAALDQSGAPVVKNGFQWMNSLDPEVQGFLTDMVLECARRYDIDGVQGDDRLPALPAEGGYDPLTIARYRREHRRASPPEDIHDVAWTQWRADILTDYLAELRAAVKKVRPSLAFSMAPGGPSWSLRDYLQDQKTWVERGLVDALHPQLYARDLAGYVSQAEAMLKIEWLGSRPGVIAPGVLGSFRDYLVSEEDALGAIMANRARSLGGEVWFYETSLLSRDGALARALGEGPYAEPARLPWRSRAGWRPAALEGVRKADGEEVVFTLTAPERGTYVIHSEAPESNSESDSERERWTEVASVRLRSGVPVEVLRVSAEEAASIARVIGLVKRD